MGNNYSDFEEASREMDSLSLEGFFGENAKKLTLSREILKQSEYFTACIDDWISDENQFGKIKVKQLILVFLKLFVNSIEIGGQKSIDAITSFMRGTKKHPEIECLSSFMEYIRLHVETKKLMISSKTEIPSISTKKRLGASLTNTYSKGVELTSKILNACIILLEISQGIKSDELEVYNIFLWKKIRRFKKLSDGKYDMIISYIDRDIRNAEVHLNLRFIPERSVFKYRIRDGKRIRNKEISAEEFIFKKYPTNGWIAQGFIYSSILLILMKLDPNLCKLKIQEIFH